MWSTPAPVLPSTETVNHWNMQNRSNFCKVSLNKNLFSDSLWSLYITVLISNTNIITFDLCLRKESDELLQKRIKLIEVIYLKKLCWIYAQKIKTFLSFPPRTTSLWSSGKIKRLTTFQRFRSPDDFHFYFLYPEIFK